MTRDRTGIRRGDGYMTERTRADGTVVYQARWFDGTSWRAKTFATADDAEDHLRGIGRRKRGGRYAPETDLTVAELVAAYLDRGAHRWTANTVATYTLLAERQIGPHLGRVRVTELTPARVQRWLDDLTGTLSASVIENARTVLSGAYREAVRLGMVAVSPVTDTRAPARPRTSKPTWTAEQAAAVLATVRDDPLYHALYRVALTTGVRPGELRALMWDDLDAARGVLTVRRSMTRTEHFRHVVGDETKTRRTRAIALPEPTLAALRVHRNDQRRRQLAAPAWAARPVIFDRGDGHPLAQQTLATHHRGVCDRAGVPRITMHALRHTFATIALGNGAHPKIVADILGHASVTITLDTYSHTNTDMQRSVIDGINRAIGEGDGEA